MKSNLKLPLWVGAAIVLTVCALTPAGDLTPPPGTPAPTMVTLQEISELKSVVSIGQSGQLTCWDAAGVAVACAGTGHDGEKRAGIAVNPRFKDNSDGSVTDNLTGLTWLKDATCLAPGSWISALSDANGLSSGFCGLTDGSAAGDWRLPNTKELMSLIDYGQSNPALPSGNPFSTHALGYWSSTSSVADPGSAWLTDSSFGFAFEIGKNSTAGVWPVRGGP